MVAVSDNPAQWFTPAIFLHARSRRKRLDLPGTFETARKRPAFLRPSIARVGRRGGSSNQDRGYGHAICKRNSACAAEGPIFSGRILPGGNGCVRSRAATARTGSRRCVPCATRYNGLVADPARKRLEHDLHGLREVFLPYRELL